MDQEDLSTTIVFSEGGGSFYYQVNVNLLKCFCSTLGSNLLKNCSTDWHKNIFGSEKCLGKQLMFLLRVSDKNLKRKKKKAEPTVRMHAQSHQTVCGHMEGSPSGSSVHGILQARILEYVAMPSSRGSSWPRDGIHVSCISFIGRWVLYHCTTREAWI